MHLTSSQRFSARCPPLYFSRMSSSDPLLMSRSAADLFHALIKFLYSAERFQGQSCEQVVSQGRWSGRALGARGGGGVGLPAPSRWETIHIFSWLSWPQEASRSSTQQPSAEHKDSPFLSVHARLSSITEEGKYDLKGCLCSVTTHGQCLLSRKWHKYSVWI